MPSSSANHPRPDDARGAASDDHIDRAPLDPEEPAAGVDDVIEFFDREPPDRPVTDADAQPPFG